MIFPWPALVPIPLRWNHYLDEYFQDETKFIKIFIIYLMCWPGIMSWITLNFEFWRSLSNYTIKMCKYWSGFDNLVKTTSSLKFRLSNHVYSYSKWTESFPQPFSTIQLIETTIIPPLCRVISFRLINKSTKTMLI